MLSVNEALTINAYRVKCNDLPQRHFPAKCCCGISLSRLPKSYKRFCLSGTAAVRPAAANVNA